MVASGTLEARPVTRALSILGLTQGEVRARPNQQEVADQLVRANVFRARTQHDLLPLERPAMERELDRRLCALRVGGALPFRKIPLVKLLEVLSWRDVETHLPVLAPFSIHSDQFSLMIDEWGQEWSRPSLPTSLAHVYDDVYKLLNELRSNRQVGILALFSGLLRIWTRSGFPVSLIHVYNDVCESLNELRSNRQVRIECKAMFQGLLPDDVRRMVMGVQKHFHEIRVLAEVNHWQIEEHERPALSDDPLVIGWDGSDFYLLAAFDLTPTEAAVERIISGTTPSV